MAQEFERTKKREEEVLAMSEDLEEHVEEARKDEAELKEDIEEELIHEASRRVEETPRRSFRRRGSRTKPKEKQGKSAINDGMWLNGTSTKNFM